MKMRNATAPTSGKIASMASMFQDGGGGSSNRGGEQQGGLVVVGRKQEVVASTRHSFPGTYRTPAPTGLAPPEKKVGGELKNF